MFQKIGAVELLIIFGVALLIFGPTKLPQLGRSVGQSIQEFKKAFRPASEAEEKE